MTSWKNVVGYEGIYAVSSDGTIKRVKPGRATHPGKHLRVHVAKNRRAKLSLTKNGVGRTFDVATLVAAAFFGPRPIGSEINHVDYDPTNNAVSNLEYIPHSENIRHAYRHGFVGGRGERHGHAKLTDHDIQLIRASPVGDTALARHYRVARSTIKAARTHKTWKHLG